MFSCSHNDKMMKNFISFFFMLFFFFDPVAFCCLQTLSFFLFFFFFFLLFAAGATPLHFDYLPQIYLFGLTDLHTKCCHLLLNEGLLWLCVNSHKSSVCEEIPLFLMRFYLIGVSH